MFYMEWLVQDDELVNDVIGRVMQGTHAANKGLNETGHAYAFQISFPKHHVHEGRPHHGNVVRVFCEESALLTMLLQQQRIKPLGRVPGVFAPQGPKEVPLDAVVSEVFVRARDADGKKLAARMEFSEGLGIRHRPIAPYFQVFLPNAGHSPKKGGGLFLKIRKVVANAAEGRALNSYGLGGPGVPSF